MPPAAGMSRRSVLLAGVAGAASLAAAPATALSAWGAGDVRATIDFAVVVQPTHPQHLGVGSSTYGASPLTDEVQRYFEERLDARCVRIPVRWDGSRVVSSAQGSGETRIAELVDLYRSWGYRVVAVIAGRNDDWSGYQDGDAAAIARVLGGAGIEYSGPNEANLKGASIYDINDRCLRIQRELNDVVPGATIWGPVWAWYSRGDNFDFARAMGSSRFGGVNYHHYAMGVDSLPTEQALRETGNWGREVAEARSDLRELGLPERVNVDELNFSWRYDDGTPGGNNRFFTGVNTVWMASVIGHILRSGGRAMPYATQNGPLGMLVEAGTVNPDGRPPSTPMPAYWGIAAWTGEHAFPHFADAFLQVSDEDDPAVETFAVTNEDGGYNLIVINKDVAGDRFLRMTLRNVADGRYDAYQTRMSHPYDAPVKATADKPYGGGATMDVWLPPCSVTTYVLKPRSDRASSR